jgi:hypothetical protein
MTTQSIAIQSPDGNRSLEYTARRVRRRRRQSAALAAGQQSVEAAVEVSSDRPSPDRPAPGRQAPGARILRRWSVADLIARAGGAPRAFA